MALPLQRFADAAIQLFYEQVRARLVELDRAFYLSGVEAVVPATASGLFVVTHKLGRVPRGWLVLDVTAPAAAVLAPDIFARTGDRRDDLVISLYAAAPFDALRLWVF